MRRTIPTRCSFARWNRCGVVALACLLLHPAATAQEPSLRELEHSAREALSLRISEQQVFLLERRQEHPPASSQPDALLAWLDAAEEAWTERCESRTSRLAAFAPYIWSWAPYWLSDGSRSEKLESEAHATRLVPSLIDDLDALLGHTEPGVAELLRRPDLGNAITARTLSADVGITALRRMRSQFDQLGSALRRIQQQSEELRLDVPDHLPGAVSQLRHFRRSVQIEIDLRLQRRAQAFVGLAAVGVAGRTPAAFREQITRLARAYAESKEIEEALAALDLGALSMSGSEWSDAELAGLYEEIGETRGRARFRVVADRRPFALIPSKIRFDPACLVDLETGEPLDLTPLEGRIIVLDYWARGCGPCLAAVPRLQRFDEEHDECVVLGVVSGESDDPAADVAAIRTRGGRYPVVREVFAEGASRGFSVHGLPSYAVVRPDGIVLMPFGATSSPTNSFDDVEATVPRLIRAERR